MHSENYFKYYLTWHTCHAFTYISPIQRKRFSVKNCNNSDNTIYFIKKIALEGFPSLRRNTPDKLR